MVACIGIAGVTLIYALDWMQLAVLGFDFWTQLVWFLENRVKA